MFIPGQKVLCIDDIPDDTDLATGLSAGSIYTIAAYAHGAYDVTKKQKVDKSSVLLQDATWNSHDPKAGYLARRFRALNDPAVEMFKKMCDNPTFSG